MSTLFNGKVKGRKEHWCFLCEEPIAKGETHRRLTCKDDGKLHTSRYHSECDRVTVIDKWDAGDWECGSDPMEFRQRRDDLRESGALNA